MLFQFTASIDEINSHTEANFHTGGRTWAGIVEGWLDSDEENDPATVVGFLVLNEHDGYVDVAYKGTYNRVAALTDPPDVAAATAAAQAAAEEVAARLAVPVRAFCGGLRNRPLAPGGPVDPADPDLGALLPGFLSGPGGMKEPDEVAARTTLIALLDAVNDGRINVFALHHYAIRGQFTNVNVNAEPPTAQLDGGRPKDVHTALLEGVFGPEDARVQTFRLLVPEYNVDATTFSQQPNPPLAVEACFRTLSLEVYRDGRVLVLSPFSPWPPPRFVSEFLVSIEYAYNNTGPNPIEDPVTPPGIALVDYTAP